MKIDALGEQEIFLRKPSEKTFHPIYRFLSALTAAVSKVRDRANPVKLSTSLIPCVKQIRLISANPVGQPLCGFFHSRPHPPRPSEAGEPCALCLSWKDIRRLAAVERRHCIGEYCVGLRTMFLMLAMRGPSFSELLATSCHSGSELKLFQASSRWPRFLNASM